MKTYDLWLSGDAPQRHDRQSGLGKRRDYCKFPVGQNVKKEEPHGIVHKVQPVGSYFGDGPRMAHYHNKLDFAGEGSRCNARQKCRQWVILGVCREANLLSEWVRLGLSQKKIPTG